MTVYRLLQPVMDKLAQKHRDATVNKLQRQNKKKPEALDMPEQVVKQMPPTNTNFEQTQVNVQTLPTEIEISDQCQDNHKQIVIQPLPVPNVRVFDYEQLKREAGF